MKLFTFFIAVTPILSIARPSGVKTHYSDIHFEKRSLIEEDGSYHATEKTPIKFTF